MREVHLAPYAAKTALSKGRRHAEPEPLTRTAFERDRDRIIHCGAFRRLEYKTQVFVNHESDLFRTRLTHSLEVAQIGRSVSDNLCLNSPLIEAISLAHDLGHTPFGHAGQDELNLCMKDFGGFEHNIQSLRVVEFLEKRYGHFDGLNLTFETREGILKHCDVEKAKRLGELGVRFIEKTSPSLEAQIVNVCDEIAYSNHDIDDGLRSGLIHVEQLLELDLFAQFWHETKKEVPDINQRRCIYETIRRMIGALVLDLSDTTKQHILHYSPKDIHEVRTLPVMVSFSETMEKQAKMLKEFLFKHLYRHYQVNRMSSKAKLIIRRLFDIFMSDFSLLPPEYTQEGATLKQKARRVADYIAGMTDRYAMREYRRLFEVEGV